MKLTNIYNKTYKYMAFRTKLDYSDNRQIKQRIETLTILSGGTSFGKTFSELPTGPKAFTSGITEIYTLLVSDFSGNGTTTIYNWADPRMSLGDSSLSAVTPINSADTQTVDPIFEGYNYTSIDGNSVAQSYSGLTFDLTVLTMDDLGGGNYSGTSETQELYILSAETGDFTGRTIWVDSSGITRTERLIITNNPQIGYVVTCIDSEGMAAWAPSVSGGSSGGTSYWSAGTGTNAIATLNGDNIASGLYSLAEGFNTQANGNYSHAQGVYTSAIGTNSHAEGYFSQAIGDDSHAEGNGTTATGNISHAEGDTTTAIGVSSHAEGTNTIASGQASHAEGYQTTAGGTASHSEGVGTIASGDSSHAEGYYSRAIGFGSHAGGGSTTVGDLPSVANGISSFVHGVNSEVNGDYSIVLGRGITGNSSNTTYVDHLNIKTLSSGSSVSTLGIDSSGNVVIGSTSGSGTTQYWSGGTGIGAIITLSGANIANGVYSIAMGQNSQAIGDYSHAEGIQTKATGYSSHAEGGVTIAGGQYSHAEGYQTIAGGQIAHAEGQQTIANGNFSHAEGYFTIANGDYSHAEGRFSRALGNCSHAGGGRQFTGSSGGTAVGDGSFVHGELSYANGDTTIVLGKNITGDTADTTYVDGFNIKTVPAGPGTIDIGVDATGKVVNQASDIRLKENINTIENALDTVLKLRGVTYNWKDRISGGDDLKIGLIAQEVLEIIPELVTDNGEYLGVQYKDIPALLIEAIKELVNVNPEIGKVYLETQTILAEDNNIELNYGGTVESAIGGGIRVLNVGSDKTADFLTDENGDWITNNNLKPNGIIIPEFTPLSTSDNRGVVGNITRNDGFLFIKTNNGWKRTILTDF